MDHPTRIDLWDHNLTSTAYKTTLGFDEPLVDLCTSRYFDLHDLRCCVPPLGPERKIDSGLQRP